MFEFVVMVERLEPLARDAGLVQALELFIIFAYQYNRCRPNEKYQYFFTSELKETPHTTPALPVATPAEA